MMDRIKQITLFVFIFKVLLYEIHILVTGVMHKTQLFSSSRKVKIEERFYIFKSEYIKRKLRFVYTQVQKICGCPEGIIGVVHCKCSRKFPKNLLN